MDLNRYFSKNDMQTANKLMSRCSTSPIMRECEPKLQRNDSSYTLGWPLLKEKTGGTVGIAWWQSTRLAYMGPQVQYSAPKTLKKKKQKITSVAEDVENENPCALI